MIDKRLARSRVARLLGRGFALASLALLAACTELPSSGAAPTVVIDVPVDGAIIATATIDVRGEIFSDAPLASLTVRNETTGASSSCAVSGTSFDCAALSLALGTNTLVATATDGSGRTGRDVSTVSYQPTGTAHLTILSPPSSGTTSSSSVDLTGAVSGFGAGLTVTVNTGALEGTCISGDGSFTCTDVPLLEGDNLLIVKGTDGAGRTASDAVFVAYDPGLVDDAAPTVTIVTPDTTSTESTILVQADVADDGLVTSVDAIVDGVRTRCAYDSDTDVAECLVLLVESVQTVVVQAVDDGGRTGSDSVLVTFDPPAPAFDIDLAYLAPNNYTTAQMNAFAEAVTFWERIVIGDLDDVRITFDDGIDPQPGEDYACGQGEPAFDGTIDDLLVYVGSFQDDSNVLGLAGPCRSRIGGADEGTNLVGYMEFNTTYLAQLEADGQLVETIVHEMGHVLGFGTNWEFAPYYDLLTYEPSQGACSSVSTFDVAPRYVGTFARLAYDRLGGVGDVPVEDSGGAGTQCGHWDEETFGNELMTGFLNDGAGVPNPLSVLSAASFLDLGLEVDLTQSEPYDPPTGLALGTQGVDLGGREILLRPLGGVDVRDGTVLPRSPAGSER